MKLFRIIYLKLCLLTSICFVGFSVEAETGDDGSAFRLESNTSTILKGANINLIVEKGVDAYSSQIGDLFISRVTEAALAEDGYTVLIPRGSWVTGRVVQVHSPGRLSKAGRVSLELDYLTTLTGDLLPLNAIISFESGKVNVEGVLDPQTGFKDKALQPTKRLLSSDTGQVVSIATLGLPVVITLLGGSAKAIVSKGDNIGLQPGEKFKIELRDDSLLLKN